MAVAARQPDVLFTGRGLFSFLLEVLGLPLTKAEADEPTVSPEALAFSRMAYDLTKPAWQSLNVQSLRQSLGEIALSVDAASFIIAHAAEPEGAARTDTRAPAPVGPSRPYPHVVARLGKPTADLLVEALEIAVGVWASGLGGRVWEDLRSASRDPVVLAQTRHRLVLGDVVPARVAQKVLASLRGEMALFMLLAAATGAGKLRDWMGVPVGEIAVEGMKVLPELLSTDLSVAAAQHALFKAQLFQRLEQEPEPEDGPEDDDEASVP